MQGLVPLRGDWDPSLGLPLMREFNEGPPGLDTYTWDIIWDEEGIAYLGRDRLYRWDGVSLKALGPESFTELKALAFDRDGNLLLGGVNMFGRYDPDSDSYESLVHLLPENEREFGLSWVVHDDGTAIWLGTTRKLFRITPSGVRVFTFEGRHRVIFHFLESGIFAHETEVGLWRIDFKGKRLINSNKNLQREGIIYLGLNSERNLLGISGSGVFILSENGEEIFSFKEQDWNPFALSCGEFIGSGLYAVGTLNNGLLIYSSNTNKYESIYHDLLSDNEFIINLENGFNGELWVCTNLGIRVLDQNLSVGNLSEKLSLPKGRIHDLAHSGQSLWVAMDGGVFDADWLNSKFDFQIHSSVEASSIFSKSEEVLYDKYIHIISSSPDGEEAVATFDREIWTFTGIGEEWICVSFSGHLGVYRWGGDGQLEETGQVSLGSGYRDLEADGTGRIWGWGPTRALLELRIDEAGRPHHDWHREGAGMQIEGASVRVAITEAGPVLVHEGGLLIWDAEAEGWELEPAEWERGLPVAVDFEREGDEVRGWMIFWDGEIRTYLMVEVVTRPGEALAQKVLPWVDMTGLGRIHLLEVMREPEHRFYIGGLHGLLVAEAGLPGEIVPPSRPILYHGERRLPDGMKITGEFGEVISPFSFASPGSGMTYPIRYQTRLSGREDTWSEPVRFPLRELGTLREGSYTFEVRAVDPFGRASLSTGITLHILPPWYRLLTTRIAGALLVAGVVLLAVWYSQRRLRRQAAILEETVNARTYELKRANEFKDDFIASLSHEIRNPLNGVIGSIEQLKPEEPVPLRSLKALRGAARYLKTSVEEMLDFAKVQSGTNPVEEEAFDLHEVVDGVLEIYHGRAAEKGLNLTRTIRIPDSVWIISDLTKVQQILGNLTGNAVKFTEAGRVTVGVIVRELENQRRGTLRLWVEDTGPGIPPGEHEAIFEKFYQARNSECESEGTGLGLALVRRFVEALNGTLELTSEPGKGSLFQVGIPLKLCPAPDMSPVASHLNLDGLKVLIVEDLEYNRVALEDFLRDQGCRVDSAENGNDGFRKACSGEHRLVFLDWELPGMNGPEISRSLREGGHLAEGTVIVGMTAFATADVREKCLQAGMDFFITKPISREQMQRILEPFARHRSLFLGWGLLGEMVAQGDQGGGLQRWLSYLDSYAGEVREAIGSDSPEAARKAAHRLLGHLRMLKVARIPELLGDLLTAAAAGEMRDVRTEWRTIESLLGALREELANLGPPPQA